MLTFSLKKEWYEKIRAVKLYWTKRLLNAFIQENALNSEKNKSLCNAIRWFRNTDDSEVGLLVSMPCVLRLGYTKQCMTAKIVKVEWLETGKDTDLAIDVPVYALHLADVREAGSGGGKRMKTRRHNRLFKEWYWGSGCGGQNLCGKTEPEKIEAAFVEGMKVAHAAMSVGMKSAFVMLFRKDDAWK